MVHSPTVKVSPNSTISSNTLTLKKLMKFGLLYLVHFAILIQNRKRSKILSHRIPLIAIGSK